MTDKEIMIDGVDVSGCEFLFPHSRYKGCRCMNDPIADASNVSGMTCEQNPNCYYKQLKRKELEFECADITIKELQKRFGEKIEKLKYKEEDVKMWKFNFEQKAKILQELNVQPHPTECCKYFIPEMKELQQKLKIAEEGLKGIINGSLPCTQEDWDCDNCGDEATEYGKSCMLKIAKQALQEIKEFLENEH